MTIESITQNEAFSKTTLIVLKNFLFSYWEKSQYTFLNIISQIGVFDIAFEAAYIKL